MKLKMPRWFAQPAPTTPNAPPPSTAELVAQLEQRLCEADGEVETAATRSQELLAKFSEARTSENLESQEAAEADLARLRKLRTLVVADLEAARSKLAAERRAELERRKTQLIAEIADHSEEIRLAQVMAEKFTPVIDALLARHAHNDNVRKMKAQLHSIKLELGEPSEMRFDPFDAVLSHFVVAEVLKQQSKEQANDAPRAALLYKFATLMEQWR